MKRWYLRNHFLPKEIEHNPDWQKLTESGKKVYRFVCHHSYLTSRSATTRYCEWTYKQIAEHVGLSRRQVATIMEHLMKTYLIYRWYAGDSGSTRPGGSPRPPRYELPASKGMIWWWKRIRNPRKKKEVKMESRYDSVTGAPINEAAFEAERWADEHCCVYGMKHHDKCQWCSQCQCWECPKCQHEPE